MYVTQIDNFIDKILDDFYLEAMFNDEVIHNIINKKSLNFVEYREKINKKIRDFMAKINVDSIKNLLNNQENLEKILDIIKRYIAYYYFLTIAYYYSGSIKDFRNNLIQYSKLQEKSSFVIKNFFDTDNNYQVITFFKIIKDVTKIITMTDFQKKTLNILEVKDAIIFLNTLGKEYIDNYLLQLVKQGDEEIVEVNTHNLIKTIVFGEIYRNQEKNFVFEIVNDIEESQTENRYIDIVVSIDDDNDLDSFKQIFFGEKHADSMAMELYELINEYNKIVPLVSVEFKNNSLLKFNFITPIVDDFLRYHRDSEKLEGDNEKSFIIPPVNIENAKNINMALLYQQRKKKENTKAQLIVTKIDALSDLYSDNVKNSNEVRNDIQKYFQGPLEYRKAVLHNYLDELKVLNKIIKQGRKVIESNEYFLELLNIIGHAYFNFKDFQKYGVSLNFISDTAINVIRYNNIEFHNKMPNLELDMHTIVNDSIINLVGLTVKPLINDAIQCIHKENFIDIRGTKINYFKNNNIVSKETDNGYKAFLRIIRHFYVETIKFSREPYFRLYYDTDKLIKINPDIANKALYWIYDINKDIYDMDTYEDFKSTSFQDTIRYMNSKLYDKILSYLYNRLVILVKQHNDLDTRDIENIIELFSSSFNLFLSTEEKKDIIIKYFLRKKKKIKSNLIFISQKERIVKPEFIPIVDENVLSIKIDLLNPLRPHKYRQLDIYKFETKKLLDRSIHESISRIKCQHEKEWNEIQKDKNKNLNKYNSELTQFIEKFVVETDKLDFICRICGQILPIKQYVQDGSFDNNTQKFVSAYIPTDIDLEEIKEYEKYKLTIKFLYALINKVSLQTGTNMLVGANIQIKQKRTAVVKNIIDLIIKHNSVNLKKKQNDDERLEFYSKKFNIDKLLDSLFFFELDDNIFDFSPEKADSTTESNKFKINIILLYFILNFITELNGAQITMMNHDKIANIYVYLNPKYGSRLFSGLLIKKNVNDMETVEITKYPVLCYLIYVISYQLIKYRLWYHPNANTKSFNPLISKIVINSFVDLINSISMDAGKMPNDYIYLLTVSKFYSQLNNTFKNNDIINVLKKVHAKYDTEKKDVIGALTQTIPLIYFKDRQPYIRPTRKIPTFKISNGIAYEKIYEMLYPVLDFCTDITNCPYGSFHFWRSKGKIIECLFCHEKSTDITGNINRSSDNYYYNMNQIASKRCLEGTIHNYVGEKGEFVCTICKRKRNEIFTLTDINDLYGNLRSNNEKIIESLLNKFNIQIKETYSKEDLNKLASNLNKIESDNDQKTLDIIKENKKEIEEEDAYRDKVFDTLVQNYKKDSNGKLYGQMTSLSDKLISLIGSFIGFDTDLGIDKYPVYLKDDVYIIDHSYNGSLFNEPIIILQKNNRIMLKENHPFFKTDVYYYTDNRTQVDVFYHAVTFKLLGYKEKHRDYVSVQKSNNYLKINPSIRNRLLTFGYQTSYIDISENIKKNKKFISDINQNYFNVLDNLIKDHIYKIKLIIDKISAILSKVKNYQIHQESETLNLFLQNSQKIEKLISKYAILIKNFNLGENDDAFSDWNYVRESSVYESVKWEETNVKPTENMYVNSEIINYYDIASNLMMYYLITQLTLILNSNNEKISKINISQLIIEIIDYVYELYNMDKYRNSLELKRFEYILYGSEYMVDIQKKGQGLSQSELLEQNIEDIEEIEDEQQMTDLQRDELEDIKEELAIQQDYMTDDDDDITEAEADYD